MDDKFDQDDSGSADGVDISPEQLDQRDQAVAAVLDILGHDLSLSIKEIQDTVWYYYFDVEKSVDYLLGALLTCPAVIKVLIRTN